MFKCEGCGREEVGANGVRVTCGNSSRFYCFPAGCYRKYRNEKEGFVEVQHKQEQEQSGQTVEVNLSLTDFAIIEAALEKAKGLSTIGSDGLWIETAKGILRRMTFTEFAEVKRKVKDLMDEAREAIQKVRG